MNKKQAINYLYSSGMSEDQVNAVVEAVSQADDDAISRQDAIKAIDEKAKRIKNEDTLNGLAGAVGILFDLPSVKPQEPTGIWVEIDEEPHEVWECDHCGFVIDGSGCIDPYDYRDTYKYCPNCGARMD